MPDQVFVSYRRDGGFEMARLIRDNLQKRGYKVFLDVEELRSGPFNTALFREIESSTDVVVILTPNSLDRCNQEGDWVRLEVAHAIKNEKNIIPVMSRGFKWLDANSLPEDLAKLPHYNGVEPSHDFWEASIDKLTKLLIAHPTRSFNKSLVLAGIACLILLVIAGIYLTSGNKRPDKTTEIVTSNIPDNKIVSSEPAASPPKKEALNVKPRAEQHTVAVPQSILPSAVTTVIKDPLALNFYGFGQRNENNIWREFQVADGITMYDGDQYRISFIPNEDSYVYIIVINADNSVDQLFPNPAIAQSNFCRRGQKYSVPDGNNRFTLDNKTGIETMVLVASYEQLNDLQELIKKAMAQPPSKKNSDAITEQIKQIAKLDVPDSDGLIRTRSGITVRNVLIKTDQKGFKQSLAAGKDVEVGINIIRGKASVVHRIQFVHKHFNN